MGRRVDPKVGRHVLELVSYNADSTFKILGAGENTWKAALADPSQAL